MQPQHTAPAITIRALLTRQLSDWQNLTAQLQAQGTSVTALAYCQAQIDRIQGELDALQD